MSNHNFTSFLDQINDGVRCDLDSCHLFRKGVAQGVSAQGDDNSFLPCHIYSSLIDAIVSTSHKTPFGRSFTATQDRAGLPVKYFA